MRFSPSVIVNADAEVRQVGKTMYAVPDAYSGERDFFGEIQVGSSASEASELANREPASTAGLGHVVRPELDREASGSVPAITPRAESTAVATAGGPTRRHPYGFRIGFNKTWKSRWFAGKEYVGLLHEDLALRADLKKRFRHAGVARIEIERAADKLKIDVHTSRPGIIIGRKGAELDKLKQEIQRRTKREVFINIQEIQKPELDAQLVAESVALQLEQRVAFRRAMRKAVESALRLGAHGIKVRVSGRLYGGEVARSEWYLHGKLPLQTLRAGVDFGFAEADTPSGKTGVKVWLYSSESLSKGLGREEGAQGDPVQPAEPVRRKSGS